MKSNKNTGIFLDNSQNGNNNKVNLSEIFAYAEKIPSVISVQKITENMFSESKHIENLISEKKLERIIIAGELPGMHKTFFTKAMSASNGNTNEIIPVSFKENGVKYKSDTDRAKALLLCAVAGIPYRKAAKPIKNDVNTETLIIGGGIAGIQASLEIANAGKKVFLLEKTGTIGGHMAMFDKTFPTLDCAACILTPKMVDVGQHSNIDLLTYSAVKSVSGKPGNYKVKILKKARRVNLATCIGCGSCAAKCPSKTYSEFDEGTTLRKAIYIPFPQAVPNKYLIDADICTYVDEPYLFTAATISKLKKEKVPEDIAEKLKNLKGEKFDNENQYKEAIKNTIGEEAANKYSELIDRNTGKCKNCVKFCPVNDCINLDAKDEVIEITVGNIIIATGFKIFDAKKAEQFGYGKFDNVLTSLELERLINAAGPTGGKITLRTTDKKGNKIFEEKGKIPESVAVIHCVGSRDENYNKYCSKVCCMYSLKLAHLVKEKLPNANVSEYYIDMRAFGKGYEEFYERIKSEGVNIIRGRTAKIEKVNGNLSIRGENIMESSLIEENVDMVVLAVGLEARKDTIDLAEMLNIDVSDEGWLVEQNSNSNPSGTLTSGVTLAGVCQGPKDIPDTVAQASAAASQVLQSILNGKISESAGTVLLEDVENYIKGIKS